MNKNKKIKLPVFKKVKDDLRDKADEIEKFTVETIREIKQKGYMNDYEISYRFSSKKRSNGHKAVAAEILVDDVYKTAELTIRPEAVEVYQRGDKEKFRKILCHELSHIKTETLAKLAFNRFAPEESIRDQLESLTEYLGRLSYRCFYGSSNSVKKEETDKNVSE